MMLIFDDWKRIFDLIDLGDLIGILQIEEGAFKEALASYLEDLANLGKERLQQLESSPKKGAPVLDFTVNQKEVVGLTRTKTAEKAPKTPSMLEIPAKKKSRKKREMSAEARARIGAAQKKRWAEWHKKNKKK